jgi:cytochrome c peroxidase
LQRGLDGAIDGEGGSIDPPFATMRITSALILALALAACGGGQSGSDSDGDSAAAVPAAKFRATPPLSLAAQVGQKIFFDKSLSGSGKMSCATCHNPKYAHGPPNDLAVQLGGNDMTTPGLRAVPSLRYKEFTPAYADLLDNPDGISVPGPGGGFTWDGRANTLAEQAGVPLLSAFEMANASAADVVAKLQSSAYAKLFRQAFGDDVFGNTTTAFNDASAALQAYQLEDSSFHPYSSKFDLYAGNKIGGTLTPAEARGMAVFSNPKIGNCSSCHYQGAGLNGSSALFTDFSYEAIGVPRNAHIHANRDPAHVDMGVCGPLRSDHTPASPGAPEVHCGMFGTPTLRNVATRKVFFHNGVIHSLEQAIRFYNTRDTNPEIWYPTVGGTPRAIADPSFPKHGLITTQYDGGTVQKFDDLPAAYRSNVDPQMPLDGRAAGSTPPMTEENIADLVCFLGTLSDGYKPPATPPTSGPCVN